MQLYTRLAAALAHYRLKKSVFGARTVRRTLLRPFQYGTGHNKVRAVVRTVLVLEAVPYSRTYSYRTRTRDWSRACHPYRTVPLVPHSRTACIGKVPPARLLIFIFDARKQNFVF